MSPLLEKPILHGRDHLPGGADPIPGFTTGSGVVYSDYVQSFSSLVGYWRLGETGTPWADSTSYGNDLNMNAHGVALTADVTGGLPAAQDDGAVKFNYTGTTLNGGDYLTTGAPSPSNNLYQFEPPFTVAAFVKVHAYPADRGHIACSMAWTGTAYSGWALLTRVDGTIWFSLGGVPGSEKYAQSPAALVLDTWYHVAGTYDGTTIKLYLNGVLVDTTAYSSVAFFGQTSGIRVGELDVSPTYLYYTGSVDELAVWRLEALTAEEIALLASAVDAVEVGDGDQVLISDGAGGSHWGQANGNAIEDEAIVDRHVATGADIDVLKLAHPGGTTSFLRADGTWATPSAGSPSADTQVWMPLTTTIAGDDVLVFDANHQLIPTLTAI